MISRRDVSRDLRLHPLEIALDGLDDRDGVGAGLPTDGEGDGGHAVEAGRRPLLFRPVFGPADVAHPDGHAVARGNDQIAEGPRVDHAPHRAQGLLAGRARDVAARQVGVLAGQRVTHRRDRQLIGRQAVGIDPHVDGALEAADDLDLPDAEGALEKRLDEFVGDLGQLAQRAVGRDGDAEDRRELAVELGDDRGTHVARQPGQDRRDAVADILGRGFDVAIEREGGKHDGATGARDRAQLVEALDGVDDLFDLLADQDLDFFGRRARQLRARDDRRQVDGGKPVDAQAHVAGGAHHDEAQDEHRGKDRTLDTDRG